MHPASRIQYGRCLGKGTLGAIFTGNTFTAVSCICKELPFYRPYGKKGTEAQGKRLSSRLASHNKPLDNPAAKLSSRGRPEASVVASNPAQEGQGDLELAAALQSIEQSGGGLFVSQAPLSNSDNESSISLPSSSTTDSAAEDAAPAGKSRHASRVAFCCKKCENPFLYKKSYLKHMQLSHGVHMHT